MKSPTLLFQAESFMNLLIVEDNPKMRRMIKSIVADLDDQIDECEDGGEAFALYSQNQPDCVLMDIHLKKTSGIDATKQITSTFHKAKIVIVTNYDDAHFRESARKAGAFDYVLKENLLDIRRILQKI
jgi:CheY-like chemotaxis protein